MLTILTDDSSSRANFVSFGKFMTFVANCSSHFFFNLPMSALRLTERTENLIVRGPELFGCVHWQIKSYQESSFLQKPPNDRHPPDLENNSSSSLSKPFNGMTAKA